MKRISSLILCSILLWNHIVIVQGIHTSASCAILMEQESGRILYEQNAHEPRLIASITKLMTALVAAESGVDMQAYFSVPKEAVGAEGSSIYLKEGEALTLETLLYGMLLHSGNDAAIAVALCCAGSVDAFVADMNEKAKELGMEHTHFENPNGLDGKTHYSTAYDMALLARACLNNDRLVEILQTKNITLEGRTFTNHNKLLWRYEGCVGLKTGYTEKAGRTLVSAATREGMTLIAVTLNDSNDWEDHSALLDWGYARYSMVSVASKGTKFGSLPITGSLTSFMPVDMGEDFSYPVCETDQISLSVRWIKDNLNAPIEQGSALGYLEVFCGKERIGQIPLIASQTLPSMVKRSGFLSGFLE